MVKQTIVDDSMPNAGRVYDYLLGGHHNFEIDRRAGDQVKAALPFVPAMMRLSRWCLQDIARTLTEERGFQVIIDFASGLPTEDHIHTAVLAGTTVIYSDHDPVTVEYGREILEGVPDAHYFEADARWPEELLSRPDVLEILGDSRHVAFVCWGLSMYVSDEDIAHLARALYDWSNETSCLAFYLNIIDPESPDGAMAIELYRQMGETFHFRPLEVFQELVKPWRADGVGYRRMTEWHGLDAAISEGYIGSLPPSLEDYGVYLVK